MPIQGDFDTVNPLISLHHGALRCHIAPALGGCVTGLWLGDKPVLRPAPDLHSARDASSYPLVPFSNRMGQATLQWQGTSHPLVKNFEPEPHAIHGVGWQRPWQVIEQGPDFALLALTHHGDATWPFAFEATQAFRLSEGTLAMSLSITNTAHTPAPVGLGWHPFFVKRPGSHLRFQARGRWEMGGDKLPTHREAHSGLDGDASTLVIDHCFDGWPGTLELRDDTLCTRVQANLSRLVVYTHDTLPSVAIEPVSHVNNALNLLAQGAATAQALGVHVLAPGESFSAEMSITTETTRP